jgi:hypothetical protein
MIPFVLGTALGILPVCIILYAAGDIWQAVALTFLQDCGRRFHCVSLIVQPSSLQMCILSCNHYWCRCTTLWVYRFNFFGLIISIFLLIVKFASKKYGKQVPSNEDEVMLSFRLLFCVSWRNYKITPGISNYIFHSDIKLLLNANIGQT